MLLSIAGYEYGGHYKADDNVILEVDASGKRKIRFSPIPASETEAAMEQLELAYLAAGSDSNINQLLLIPCVILDFLCIHPFQDGNGRMSRLLSLLLLYKSGYDVGKYVSFYVEKHFFDDKWSLDSRFGRALKDGGFTVSQKRSMEVPSRRLSPLSGYTGQSAGVMVKKGRQTENKMIP